MPQQRTEFDRSAERRFESEPADEWVSAYGRGGPIRSDEPERDYFFERNAAPSPAVASDPGNRADQRTLRRMNWRAQGVQDYPGGALEQLIGASHRGKGPRDYRPSDERLREKICERLTDDPFIDATNIDIAVAGGEVTLSGSVDTRAMKFAAEELVDVVHGVSAISNAIRVRKETL